MRWARSSPATLAVPFHLYDPKSLRVEEGPVPGQLTFGLAVDPINKDAVQRQKVDLPMLDVYSADASQGAVKLRGRVFTPRPVTWRSRADVLVVLKRWKSFSRGGDELQIYELHVASLADRRPGARRPARSAAARSAAASEIQEANELYKRGRYQRGGRRVRGGGGAGPEPADAVAEQGLHLPAADRAGRAAIRRAGAPPTARSPRSSGWRELAPNDPRADQLTVQTWFDTDDFATLEKTFLERNRRAPDDYDVVHGLQEVYYKWGKWPQALEWSTRAAALRAERRRGAVRRRHLHLADPGGARRRPRHGRLRSAPARRRPRRDDARRVPRQASSGKADEPELVPPPPPPADACPATSPARRASSSPTRRSPIWRRRSRCARTTRTR